MRRSLRIARSIAARASLAGKEPVDTGWAPAAAAVWRTGCGSDAVAGTYVASGAPRSASLAQPVSRSITVTAAGSACFIVGSPATCISPNGGWVRDSPLPERHAAATGAHDRRVIPRGNPLGLHGAGAGPGSLPYATASG